MRAHGCRWWAIPCRTPLVRDTSGRSAGINEGLGGVQPRMTTRIGAPQRGQRAVKRLRGRALRRPGLAGVALPDQRAEGRERDATAGMEQAEVANLLQAIGQDMREEPAEKRHTVEVGSAEAGTAHFPGGAGARAVREADKTVGGDGDLADRGGQIGEGGVAVVMGLPMDIPGDGPDLGIDVLEQASVAHGFCEEGTGEGGKGVDGDKEGGAGGPPGRAVLCEAPTGTM